MPRWAYRLLLLVGLATSLSVLVTVTLLEKLEVFPERSVAVAMAVYPAGTAAARAAEKFPFVLRMPAPRKNFASPEPAGLAKNSRRRVAPPGLAILPKMVVPPALPLGPKVAKKRTRKARARRD